MKMPARRPLGRLPTPIVALERLSADLAGPRILIKRDDLIGIGLGGNKVRKLEYLVADALARGCDTLVTAGATQSNHCRQTAAVAAACGLECHLVLGGEAQPPRGNLLLDTILGAHIHFAGDDRTGESMPAVLDALRSEGKRPYAIPYGGSNALGACGFVHAADEMQRQLDGLNVDISHLVFASSSGGTHVGLAIGAQVAGARHQTIGVLIDSALHAGKTLHEKMVGLAVDTGELLGLDRVPDGFDLWTGFTGDGYGVVGDRERDAIRLLARTEGILLDPVYTGRAFGALVEQIAAGVIGPDDTVLFWHTGGAPALFPYADALTDGSR